MSRLRSALFGSHPLATDLGLLALRVGLGLSMAVTHGLGMVPPSEGFVGNVADLGFFQADLFAWLAGLAQLVGGTLIAVGLLSRPAAAVLAVTMGVAFFLAHAGDPFGLRELSFVYGVVALGFVLTGPGRFSLDHLLTPRSVRLGPEAEQARPLRGEGGPQSA